MIFFRLDANIHVATGHLFRCISIASRCREIGLKCAFLLGSGEYAEMLEKKEFEYYVLNLPWDDWNQGTDEIIEILTNNHAECLIVDSYRVTEHFFAEMKKATKVFYLDDICKQVYPVDMVLHYSEWEDDHIIEQLYRGTDTRAYCGMQYTPLREEFSRGIPDNKCYDILITTGGTDPYHVTTRVLREMKKRDLLRNYKTCVVLGKFFSDNEEMDVICREARETSDWGEITVLQNISNMNEIMAASKFAIASGGITVYELMASGVAFTCFGFSEDQRLFGERLEKHGNAAWSGDVREEEFFEGKICDNLKKMLSLTEAQRQEIVERNHNCVDGKGAARIAGLIRMLVDCEEENHG